MTPEGPTKRRPEASTSELAAFQTALLSLLDEGLPAEETLRRLRADDAFAPFAEYVSRFDARMVAVAVALMAKWGRRRSEAIPTGPRRDRP